MTLRVSHLVAALVLLSLGGSQIGVNAADCTDEEQAYIDENYTGMVQGVDTYCSSDVCSYSCQDQLSSSVASLPDCTASDGTNYHETLAADYACSESSGSSDSPTANAEDVCSEDNEILTGNVVDQAALGDCGADHPCEAECNAKLQQLVAELPDCTLTSGQNYYQYYLSLVQSCPSTDSSGSASETTPAPAETTAAPTTATAAPTATTASPTATTSAPSNGENLTSSEATEEEETTEASASAESSASASAAGSASASKDNGAAAVGGSAIGSLVVAGTLALLAAQA